MSEEQGSFDFYNEYAESRKLEISTIDQIVNVRHGYTKRIAVIYGIKDLFFIAYSNPGDMSSIGMFCGVFFESDISPELTFSLRKADFLDKLSFKKSKSIFKLQNKNCYIESNNTELLSGFFSNKDLQQRTIDLFDINPLFFLGFNDLEYDFSDLFKSSSVTGVYLKQRWLFDFDELDLLFAHTGKIKNCIIGDKTD